jgi:hypothetical protein
VRGAVGDADVIVLVSDVYGEPLADAKIMQKYVGHLLQIVVFAQCLIIFVCAVGFAVSDFLD